MSDPTNETENETAPAKNAGLGVVGLVLILVWPIVTFAVGIALVLGLPPTTAGLAGLLLPVGMLLVRLVVPSAPARRLMLVGIVLVVVQITLNVIATPTDLPDAPPPDAVETSPQDDVDAPPSDDVPPPDEPIELPLEMRLIAAAQALLLGAAVGSFAWGMRRWLHPAGEEHAATWWTIYALLAAVIAIVTAVQAFVPMSFAAEPGLTLSTVLTLLGALVLLAELIVHLGACITGIVAVRRLG